jgi:glucose-1-phosphate adenylyltransferase
MFGAHAEVEGSLVAGGSRVDGDVEGSILFPGAVVERGATVRGALLFNDVLVRAGARVERSILDKFVEVGANARIGGPSASGNPLAGEGLTLVGKDVHVPADAAIGRGCVVGVGAGPGDLGNGNVPDGTVVAGRVGGGGWA